MAKRKQLELEMAFAPPFYPLSNYPIPLEDETILVDMFSKLTATLDEPDLVVGMLAMALQELSVPAELIPSAEDFLKQGWCIDQTDIVDFEKWLYKGHWWLLLGRNVAVVDKWWHVLGKELRTEEVAVNELYALFQTAKIGDGTHGYAQVVEMFNLASDGKLYIDYLDFYVLLGRLGLLIV